MIVTVHEFRYNKRWLGWLLAGDRTIAPSAALALHLRTQYGFDPETIAVIPNAIPLKAAMAGAAGENANHAERKNTLVVGCLGRLSAEKGVRYFIESIPLASRECPGTKYVVFGDGPEEQDLRTLAKRLRIEDATLSFRGWCDPLEAMDELDVLVIPSLEEGFPYVALEAMRASLPIVATRVGGLPEIVADHESGFLVPPQDPAGIASAVCALLRNSEMRIRFGHRGRTILEERFSLEVMIRSTLRVYESALGQALVG